MGSTDAGGVKPWNVPHVSAQHRLGGHTGGKASTKVDEPPPTSSRRHLRPTVNLSQPAPWRWKEELAAVAAAAGQRAIGGEPTTPCLARAHALDGAGRSVGKPHGAQQPMGLASTGTPLSWRDPNRRPRGRGSPRSACTCRGSARLRAAQAGARAGRGGARGAGEATDGTPPSGVAQRRWRNRAPDTRVAEVAWGGHGEGGSNTKPLGRGGALGRDSRCACVARAGASRTRRGARAWWGWLPRSAPRGDHARGPPPSARQRPRRDASGGGRTRPSKPRRDTEKADRGRGGARARARLGGVGGAPVPAVPRQRGGGVRIWAGRLVARGGRAVGGAWRPFGSPPRRLRRAARAVRVPPRHPPPCGQTSRVERRTHAIRTRGALWLRGGASGRPVWGTTPGRRLSATHRGCLRVEDGPGGVLIGGKDCTWYWIMCSIWGQNGSARARAGRMSGRWSRTGGGGAHSSFSGIKRGVQPGGPPRGLGATPGVGRRTPPWFETDPLGGTLGSRASYCQGHRHPQRPFAHRSRRRLSTLGRWWTGSLARCTFPGRHTTTRQLMAGPLKPTDDNVRNGSGTAPAGSHWWLTKSGTAQSMKQQLAWRPRSVQPWPRRSLRRYCNGNVAPCPVQREPQVDRTDGCCEP